MASSSYPGLDYVFTIDSGLPSSPAPDSARYLSIHWLLSHFLIRLCQVTSPLYQYNDPLAARFG